MTSRDPERSSRDSSPQYA